MKLLGFGQDQGEESLKKWLCDIATYYYSVPATDFHLVNKFERPPTSSF